MNTPEPPHDLDAYLRRLFAPDAAAVERVLARAWRAPTPFRRLGPWSWSALALTTLAIAALVVWRRPPPTVPPVHDAPLTITGDRDLVVVERAVDGRRWVVVPAQDAALIGNYVIVTER